MENEFKKVMSERTDEELIKIVTAERHKYQPLAIQAAEFEVENRNIDTSLFSEIKEKSEIEAQSKQNVDSNVVGSSVRFLHFIIDIIVAYIITLAVLLVVGFIFSSVDNILFAFFTVLLTCSSFFAYYVFMEIKFQKTVGKFLTKTKVVTLNGEKPLDRDIFIRTFCRMIPFDFISFLFMKNGFHDILSKTKVVKDLL